MFIDMYEKVLCFQEFKALTVKSRKIEKDIVLKTIL